MLNPCVVRCGTKCRATPEPALLARNREPRASQTGGRPAGYLDCCEEAVERIVGDLRDGDVCFTIGAGDVTELGPMLRERLERRT